VCGCVDGWSSLTEAAGWEWNDTAPSEDPECVSNELAYLKQNQQYLL